MRALFVCYTVTHCVAHVCPSASAGCTDAERNAIFDDAVIDQLDQGLHLLQVRAAHKPRSLPTVQVDKTNDGNQLANYKPSMTEWMKARGELLQLREIAKNGTSSHDEKASAELLPMLEVLTGLYNDSKHSIAQLNTREVASKERFAAQQARHEVRLAEIEERSKNHTLSEEFVTNETRDENRMFEYWTKVRDNEHKQFISFLQVKHGMMDKLKTMIDAYEAVLSGSMNQSAVDVTLGSAGAVPVALVQLDTSLHRSVAEFCRDALDKVDAVLALSAMGAYRASAALARLPSGPRQLGLD